MVPIIGRASEPTLNGISVLCVSVFSSA